MADQRNQNLVDPGAEDRPRGSGDQQAPPSNGGKPPPSPEVASHAARDAAKPGGGGKPGDGKKGAGKKPGVDADALTQGKAAPGALAGGAMGRPGGPSGNNEGSPIDNILADMDGAAPYDPTGSLGRGPNFPDNAPDEPEEDPEPEDGEEDDQDDDQDQDGPDRDDLQEKDGDKEGKGKGGGKSEEKGGSKGEGKGGGGADSAAEPKMPKPPAGGPPGPGGMPGGAPGVGGAGAGAEGAEGGAQAGKVAAQIATKIPPHVWIAIAVGAVILFLIFIIAIVIIGIAGSGSGTAACESTGSSQALFGIKPAQAAPIAPETGRKEPGSDKAQNDGDKASGSTNAAPVGDGKGPGNPISDEGDVSGSGDSGGGADCASSGSGSIPGLPDISDVPIKKVPCGFGNAPGGCYQLPKSKYWTEWGGGRFPQDWTGSKCMVQLIAATSKAWKEKYPKDEVFVGDINAPGHASHKVGEDVDINTTTAADNTIPGYSVEKTIEYGKLWMSTGSDNMIITVNDKVISGINGYAKEQKVTGYAWIRADHNNHFHVRINDDAKGECVRSGASKGAGGAE